MTYNYYFSIASGIVLIFILFCENLKFSERTVQNRRFIRITFALFVACVVEVFSCMGFMGQIRTSNMLNVAINDAYFWLMAVSVYSYCLYIEGFTKSEKIEHTVFKKTNMVLMIVYSISHVLNVFVPIYFYFDENSVYHHCIFYNLLYLIPMYLLVYGIVQLFRYSKKLSVRQVISMLTFCLLIIFAATAQFIFIPDIMISLFAGTCGLIIVFFFLETPDFKVLLDTMEELKKAEEVAQEERIKAYAANQAKSSFLANVSHEIRTPINAVLGMNEMIMRETSEDNIREYALDVNSAGRSLLAIINDILDISKIEAGKMEVVLVEYEPAAVLDDIYIMTTVRAEQKNLKFTLDCDTNMPSKLLGDDIRIKQIVMNILSNSVKYTNEGEIVLSIKCDNKGDTTVLHISVADTGIGIKDEEKEKLFVAFQRLDEKTNRNVEGTGLGMSITNELLTLMGSKLEFESEYGVGSTFYFDLEQKIIDNKPMGDFNAAKASQIEQMVSTISFTAPNAKLLVVDDNSINRKVVIGLLKDVGCLIDEAGSGFECVEMIKQKQYDLIFLDHLMPGMDGVMTMEKIKSEENLCMETPVIAFTANAISGMKESFLNTGFNGFISKPVDSGQLVDIVKEFLPEELIIEGAPVKSRIPAEKALPELDDFDFRYARVCLGEAGLIKSVAKDFYDQSSRIEKALNQYLENLDEDDNIGKYRTDIHALKSTSRMLGEISLSGLAKASEEAAKEGNGQAVRQLHPLIISELNRAREELTAIVPKEEEVTKTTLEDGIVIDKLTQLSEALANRDVKKQDEIAKELSGYNYSEDISSQMEEIIEYIKILKMLKATKVVEEVLQKLGDKKNGG